MYDNLESWLGNDIKDKGRHLFFLFTMNDVLQTKIVTTLPLLMPYQELASIPSTSHQRDEQPP
jgi:hypothetical protein